MGKITREKVLSTVKDNGHRDFFSVTVFLGTTQNESKYTPR